MGDLWLRVCWWEVALALVDFSQEVAFRNAEVLGLALYGYLVASFLVAYVRGGWRANIELCIQIASEEPHEIGYKFGSCLPFLDPSNKLVGPLDRARVVGPIDVLVGYAGDGVSGGDVTDLSDGATMVVEVRGNFGETPTFWSKILGVGCVYDIGDDAEGLCCSKGGVVN